MMRQPLHRLIITPMLVGLALAIAILVIAAVAPDDRPCTASSCNTPEAVTP